MFVIVTLTDYNFSIIVGRTGALVTVTSPAIHCYSLLFTDVRAHVLQADYPYKTRDVQIFCTKVCGLLS